MTNPFSQFGSNSGYIEDLYRLYLQSPNLVGDTWRNFFDSLSENVTLHASENKESVKEIPLNVTATARTNGNTIKGEASRPVDSYPLDFITEKGVLTSYLKPAINNEATQERIYRLVSAFRGRGHLKAKINPLHQGLRVPTRTEDIDIGYYNFTPDQLNEVYGCAGFAGRERMPLGELIDSLEQVYAGTIGFEITHILSQEERLWLQYKIETRFEKGYGISSEEKTWLLRKLVQAEGFEEELHKKYIGHKRFSLQGAETVIPMLAALIEKAADLNIGDIVFGMAHRGRLNVLRHTLEKPLSLIFSEFEDQNVFSALGSGDVKYHLGFKTEHVSKTGKTVHLSLAPNPSHLEYVSPVVEGMVRAKQDLDYSRSRSEVLGVLMHGDAAFIGQGVVPECLNQSTVPGFRNGGTVHIIINNQIGFTTSPVDARSSTYCTDFAKGIQAPIFHVNCEDVEAAAWAISLAMEFRGKYNRDVVLDLYCWRKYGHNEGDDPSYTQPVVYAEIKNKANISKTYSDKLIEQGVITSKDYEKMFQDVKDDFEANSLEKISNTESSPDSPILKISEVGMETAVQVGTIEKIIETLVEFPDSFTPHPKLERILKKRHDALLEGEGMDWGFAESVAFGSLVEDGISVRLCGQDSGRGTFSHRHLMLSDYKTGENFVPFEVLGKETGSVFEVYNSTLSEISVLGFEYGYSVVAKEKTLVLWEAQFGDFGNCAQVIIDQFITSSEQKWGQYSSIVLLLPHGYEGQGPEHSSARLERFLQICAKDNITVSVPSNGAQYFHLIRRQALRKIRKPLVVMTPKSLLRSVDAACTLADFTHGAFSPILNNDFGNANQIENVILCSGKVYYDIRKFLNEREELSVKVLRLEQLYPFPLFELRKAINGIYAKNLLWVQEEPKNMGAWSYVSPIIKNKLDKNLIYVGREESASPATGSPKIHAIEIKKFLDEMYKIIS